MAGREEGTAGVDAYLAGLPEPVRGTLGTLREAARGAAPEAVEAVKYGMPTLVLDGNVLHYGAHKEHVGIYPVPRGVEGFEEVGSYAGDKSTMRLPLEGPVPVDLIRRIVQHQIGRNRERVRRKEAGS